MIVEFPLVEHVRRWHASADHADALAVRRTALARRLLVVEDLDGRRLGPRLAGS